MNPRVPVPRHSHRRLPASRSRKIATKLSLGYTLDEIPNGITKTPASLRPTLDFTWSEGSALRLEVPGCRPDPDHHHEERGRGHGPGPSTSPGSAEGHAFARAEGRVLLVQAADPLEVELAELIEGQGSPPLNVSTRFSGALLAGGNRWAAARLPKVDPWFLDQLVLLNKVAGVVYEAVTTWIRDPEAGQTPRLLGCTNCRDYRLLRERCARCTSRPWVSAGLQDCCTLCRRV